MFITPVTLSVRKRQAMASTIGCHGLHVFSPHSLERDDLAAAFSGGRFRIGWLRCRGCACDLIYEATYLVGSALLHPVCHMGVGVQREARRVMSQHTGERLDIHAALHCHGGKRVPLRYNYDKPEKPDVSRA